MAPSRRDSPAVRQLAAVRTPEHVSLADLTGEPHARALAGPPRAVRLSLGVGDAVPAHRHPESHVLVHLLEGDLDRRLDGVSYAMEPGDLVQFDGERRVEPRAAADSVALVVFAPKDD
jgi:quercetin dioxygenase-like cupin family protein